MSEEETRAGYAQFDRATRDLETAAARLRDAFALQHSARWRYLRAQMQAAAAEIRRREITSDVAMIMERLIKSRGIP